MPLSNEQEQFLIKHGKGENLLFNANGMSRDTYRARMKKEGKKVAYNVTPCHSGHTLRTRHGHCIQCDKARIAFVTRNAGTLYLAGSRSGKLFKVGFTKSKKIREESLNKKNEGYAGLNDWEILLYFESIMAGEVEQKVHALLLEFKTLKSYYHEGKMQEAKELFDCPYLKLKEAIIFSLNSTGEELSIIKEKNHRIHRYEYQKY